jgi:hypothetical protein
LLVTAWTSKPLACDRLDINDKPLGFVDAADILRERGHTDLEIMRLVGEFAKDLLLVAKEDKRFRTIGNAQFGSHVVVEKEISLYHCVDDSRLIEHVDILSRAPSVQKSDERRTASHNRTPTAATRR